MLLAGALVAIAVIIAVVDPNEYRDEIRQAVQRETGRELRIDGDLELSLFPWIGLGVGGLQLGNAPGFGEQPFAAVREAQIRVQLLPLLSRELRIDTIRLDGLSLALQRDAEGRGNWEDLAGGGEDAAADTDSSAAAGDDAGQGGGGLAALAIGGLQIVDAQITLRDRQAGSDLAVDQVNLRLGAVLPDEPFPLEFGARYASASQGVAALLALSGEVTVAAGLQRLAIAGLELSVDASGEVVPGGSQRLQLTADVGVDLAAQTARLAGLSGEAAGVAWSGELEVVELLAAPRASGRLEIAEFDARALLERLAMAAPDSADAEALGAVSAALSFSADADSAALSELLIGLDGSRLSGDLAVTDYAAPGLEFALELDRIDVDRYLPPPAPEGAAEQSGDQPAGGQAAGGQAGGSAAGAVATADADDIPIELPLELLRSLQLDGRLRIGELKVAGLRAAQVDLPLSAADGLVQIPGLAADLYGGTLRQSARLDARGEQPAFAADARLAGVDIGPLLVDATGSESLSGKGSVDVDLRTGGATVGALKRALDGELAVDLRNGAVPGIDIGADLRRAEAKLKGESFGAEDARASTDFASLAVSAVIEQGVLRSDDLDMRSPLLRVGGDGSVDLPREYVDYRARVLLTDSTKGQGGRARSELAGWKITVPIRGHFDELATDFVGAVTAALKERAKAKLKAREDEIKRELRESEEQAKRKLREREEQAKRELREKEAAEKARLKEKEKAAKQRAEEKLKDELRDGLKGLFD